MKIRKNQRIQKPQRYRSLLVQSLLKLDAFNPSLTVTIITPYTQVVMLCTTHALTGGLIITKVGNPFFSLPLILLTHYIMDAIPHWDFGTKLRKRGRLKTAILGIAELAFALIVSWFLFQKSQPFSLLLWAGIFLSLAPDFADSPYRFLGLNLPFSKQLYRLHHRFHKKHVFFWGLLPQVIIIALILFLL